jgi:hypothetical protein
MSKKAGELFDVESYLVRSNLAFLAVEKTREFVCQRLDIFGFGALFSRWLSGLKVIYVFNPKVGDKAFIECWSPEQRPFNFDRWRPLPS